MLFAIKPVYADLTKADILQKCLHGLTENPNESFNSTIWEKAPKTVYCGLDTLEIFFKRNEKNNNSIIHQGERQFFPVNNTPDFIFNFSHLFLKR